MSDTSTTNLGAGMVGVRKVLIAHKIDPGILDDPDLETKQELITFSLREADNPYRSVLRLNEDRWIKPPRLIKKYKDKFKSQSKERD